MEVFENYEKGQVGSSRIRAGWLLNYWPEAEMYRVCTDYDAMIFQKAYFMPMLEKFPGIKIFDLCDPDWLFGKPVVEAISHCDAVTTSTEALAQYLRQITDKPVLCIPDRVDLAEHMEKKKHDGPAKKVVWFGYSSNQDVLDQCLMTLQRLGLKLTVISELPYYPKGQIQGITEDWIKENIINLKYDYSTINQDLLNCGDMVLNPRLETGRFKFKSNNKTLTAWALGLPVAENAEDLERFMDPGNRRKEAELRVPEIKEKHDVRLSVAAYKELIALCQKNRPTA